MRESSGSASGKGNYLPNDIAIRVASAAGGVDTYAPLLELLGLDLLDPRAVQGVRDSVRARARALESVASSVSQTSHG